MNTIPKISNFLRGPTAVAYRQALSGAFNNFKPSIKNSILNSVLPSNEPEPNSTLLNGLMAYWPADTTDGVDIISGNIVNVVGGNAENQPGKIGNCWSPLTGGASIQQITDTINIQFANSFTLACWLRFEIAPSSAHGCFRKLGVGITGYEIVYPLGSQFRFRIGVGGSSLTVDGPAIDIDNQWHRVVAYYDEVRNVIGIYKDNAAAAEVSLGALTYDPPLASDDLILAQLVKGAGGEDVQIDEMGMWNRIWTAAEKLEHWNSGLGKAYPFN